MRRFRSAILAGIAAAGLLGLGPGPLPEPMPVSFRLADGARVTGKMTAWDVIASRNSSGMLDS